MYLRAFFAPRREETHNIKFWYTYLITVVFMFQTLLVAYSSSTYLGTFISTNQIGLLYSAAAFLSIVIFLILPKIMVWYGNVLVTIALMLGSILTLWFVGGGLTPSLVIISFILFQAINPLLHLNIDIFSETLIGKREGGTGHKRGLALAFGSGISLFAPLTMGYLVGDGDNLAQLYYLAIVTGVIFIVIILAVFRHFYDPVYTQIKCQRLFASAWRNLDIRIVLTTHFILQLFFTWTMIYVPLYLATVVGLSWSAIGYIIAAGLFGYLVCEYPIGALADNYCGEKEMMALGFLILTLTIASITAMTTTVTLAWMLLMFTSRIGASLVEVTTESYFFKKVAGEDAELISLFRLMRPLATLIGALLGSLALYFMPFQLIFLVLAFCMVIGIFCTIYLTDTK
jgi:hypothetical protein